MAVVSYGFNDAEIVSYEGCVLGTYERNGRWDSDFYAICVNVETGRIDTVEYNTTRCGGTGRANVDITEENFRRYLRAAYKAQVSSLIESNKCGANEVEVGKTVRVIKGRKVPIGTVGTVFWQKAVNYDKYQRWWKVTYRIGIKDENGEVYWTNQDNVVVVNPEQYKKSMKEIIKSLKRSRSKKFQEAKTRYKW